MKKYIVKLQYQETFLTYSEKLEYFEWIKTKYECLPNNAFLTVEQFEKARQTVLKNLISFIVFIEEKNKPTRRTIEKCVLSWKMLRRIGLFILQTIGATGRTSYHQFIPN